MLGANTYRLFADYWPTPQSDDQLIAPRINELPKLIVSKSLREAPWGGYPAARIDAGDPVEAVRQAAAGVLGDVIVWGSIRLVQALYRADAIDELRLTVCPVVLGSGIRLLPPATERRGFTLSTAAAVGGAVEMAFAATRGASRLGAAGRRTSIAP